VVLASALWPARAPVAWRCTSGLLRATVAAVVRFMISREQALAAQVEVSACLTAGLEPDPLVVKMANPTVVDLAEEDRERQEDDR
jgi:hypothetical protein